jgi:predicted nucleotidyltransferase
MDREGVEEVVAKAVAWATSRADVRALALVGSWARDAPTGDSDVDLVVLSEEPERFERDDEWITRLGAARLLRRRRWGVLTEHRLAIPSGTELDVGVAPTSWASTGPVDAGTRRVVADGMRALHDPDGLLDRLAAAVERG